MSGQLVLPGEFQPGLYMWGEHLVWAEGDGIVSKVPTGHPHPGTWTLEHPSWGAFSGVGNDELVRVEQ